VGSNPTDKDTEVLKSLIEPLRNRSRVVIAMKPVYRSVTDWDYPENLTTNQKQVLDYVRHLTEEVGGSCVGQEIIPFYVKGREESQRALDELVELGALSRTKEETWKIFDPLVDKRGEISG